jgi:hypothetical protein
MSGNRLKLRQGFSHIYIGQGMRYKGHREWCKLFKIEYGEKGLGRRMEGL